MKKLFYLFMIALMAISMTFVACKKDGNNEKPIDKPDEKETFYVIEAIDVQEGSSSITTVKALVLVDDVYKSIASANYSNNAFKLELPDKIDAISNPLLKISGYNNENMEIGSFLCISDNNENFLSYYYSGSNYVHYSNTIHKFGDILFTKIYECDYKKGWNIQYTMYEIDADNSTYTITTTTTKPSNVNFIWSFFNNDDKTSEIKDNHVLGLMMQVINCK